MKRVLVGHRGVGKSALLKRHQTYFPETPHYDLDQQIEQQERKSIIEIFESKGEPAFRDIEKNVFFELYQKNPSFTVSLGAGFNVDLIPKDVEIIFVSRITDSYGRIFLDRPRLNHEVSPLDEYKARYHRRHEKYTAKADHIYFMAEGLECENEIEKSILKSEFTVEDAYYTLVEKEISKLDQLKKNYKRIELRTDLIPAKEILNIVKADPGFNWLVSIRTNEQVLWPENLLIDCDVKFKSETKKAITSCHLDSVEDGIGALRSFATQLKLSPVVETFSDLVKGHKWQQQDPNNRSFHPRSKNGKWLWYRQCAKYFQKINFIRSFTLIQDQPSAYQWLQLPNNKPKSFAAVLGSPVLFSRSPEEHRRFFNKTYFTAIDLNEHELSEYHHWLHELGLSYAAVTSPLKETAFKIASTKSLEAETFQSANTLLWRNEKIQAHNTDMTGFQELTGLARLKSSDCVAVWGGGGTLNMMKKVLPQAHFYAARTGQLREGQPDKAFFPEIVIWSAPRQSDTMWPPSSWQTKTVIDLNYLENSMGLEYAQKMGCTYISGLAMFKAQAAAQRKFWSQA